MEVSRSGRARKKSAKLLMMEESEIEFTALSKPKRRSDSESGLKSPTAIKSPKKQNIISPKGWSSENCSPETVSHTTEPTQMLAPMSLVDKLQAGEDSMLEIDMTPPPSKGKNKRVKPAAFDHTSGGDFSDSDYMDTPAPTKKRKANVPKTSVKQKRGNFATSDSDSDFKFDEALQDERAGREEEEVASLAGGEAPGEVTNSDDEWDKYGVSDDDEFSESELQEMQKMRGSQVPVLKGYIPPEPTKKKQPVMTSPVPTVMPSPVPTVVSAPLPLQTTETPTPKVKKVVERKKSAKEVMSKKASKARINGYSLWCQTMRKDLLKQNPNIDFANLSQKLGELWNTVPAQKKAEYQRKARALQRKQDLGKQVQLAPTSTHMRSGQPQQMRSPTALTPAQHALTAAALPPPTGGSTYKGVDVRPIDLAAHLTLLGESLATIGSRLQEHRGQIAVQGSLSVLLDSLLCALGPLTSLTTQVPLLDVIEHDTHRSTLDNLAYIMPGIG